MNLLMVLGLMIFVVWAYILFVRPLVLAHFPKLQATEKALWAGSRQVLMARVMSLGGLVVGFHDLAAQSGADATTFLGEVAKVLPPQYQALAVAGVLFLSGIVLEWFRRVSKGPVGSSLPPQ